MSVSVVVVVKQTVFGQIVPSRSFFTVQGMDIPRCAPEIPPPIPVTPGVQGGQDSAPSGLS